MHFDEQWIKVYWYAGLCGSESDVLPVREEHIDAALEIAASQGISSEPSGIAGLALMLQMKDRLPRDKKMLIINTGKTRIPK